MRKYQIVQSTNLKLSANQGHRSLVWAGETTKCSEHLGPKTTNDWLRKMSAAVTTNQLWRVRSGHSRWKYSEEQSASRYELYRKHTHTHMPPPPPHTHLHDFRGHYSDSLLNPNPNLYLSLKHGPIRLTNPQNVTVWIHLGPPQHE